jgi:hypothetical protein
MKAFYLALVFSSPLLVGLLPLDWFQFIWLPLWAPFALLLGVVTFLRPRSEMFAWIFFAPILFWLLINVAVPIAAALSGDTTLANWGPATLVILTVSTPIGILVGLYWLLAAFGLFALFRELSWLK